MCGPATQGTTVVTCLLFMSLEFNRNGEDIPGFIIPNNLALY